MQLLQCTATLPGDGGQWNSYHAWAHQLGDGESDHAWAHQLGDGESCPGGGHCLNSGTPAMHCHTAWAQGALELMSCTASLPGGMGSATLAMHCHTAWGRWAVELLPCVGPPTRGRRVRPCVGPPAGGRRVLPKRRSLPKQRNSCNALPHCLGAVGSGTHVMHCLTAWGQWAVQFLQNIA